MPYVKGIVYILCAIFLGLKYITVMSITTYKAIYNILSLFLKELEAKISDASFIDHIKENSGFFSLLQPFIKNLKNLLDN